MADSALRIHPTSERLPSPYSSIQNDTALRAALVSYREGFNFADALNHASCAECESVATFDHKGFARKANKRAMLPRVSIPQ